MQIFLIGYRGCGKSTVAKIIQEKKSKLSIYHLDQEIEKKIGQTIPEIIRTRGWDFFRETEAEVLGMFADKAGIIDCGGGIIEGLENRRLLKEKPLVFFLKTSLENLHVRLSDKTDRPSLTANSDFLSEISLVYSRRLPLYEECARYIIDADGDQHSVAMQVLRIITDFEKTLV
jgi:shikimate kinase